MQFGGRGGGSSQHNRGVSAPVVLRVVGAGQVTFDCAHNAGLWPCRGW